MKEPKISLIASAARPRFWNRFWNSLVWNDTPYEVIFVGPNEPFEEFPEHFRFIKSNCKPAQCYEAGLRAARGVIVGWTADDANYNHPQLQVPKSLDIIWQLYEKSDGKTIFAQRPYEDGGDIGTRHRLIHDNYNTPLMAPFGFINREWFMKLGGYDRNFICGQSENDVVMRAIEDGGRVELVMESPLWVHHAECHGNSYDFRKGYDWDRAFLESCWFMPDNSVSPKRLKALEPFDDTDILTINQGPAGKWTSQ
jgi:hypothetical protein